MRLLRLSVAQEALALVLVLSRQEVAAEVALLVQAVVAAQVFPARVVAVLEQQLHS